MSPYIRISDIFSFSVIRTLILNYWDFSVPHPCSFCCLPLHFKSLIPQLGSTAVGQNTVNIFIIEQTLSNYLYSHAYFTTFLLSCIQEISNKHVAGFGLNAEDTEINKAELLAGGRS